MRSRKKIFISGDGRWSTDFSAPVFTYTNKVIEIEYLAINQIDEGSGS